ncbi:hypothetical protein [Actinomadura atramentaria]|uniref:hypothetical protein n=1 Tax=Actinomadura atramentaria TaxID=1990 RepID=UPI0004764490|nr:hypothetical protein [Actinomadura atramentaria]
MSVARAHDPAQVRRHHLALLARAVGARGLHWRLAGPEESVLAVSSPRTGHQVMIVAMPTGTGWSYLWTGGGIADVADADRAADAIAHRLT